MSSVKKSREDRIQSRYLSETPDLLPESAHRYWPDLNGWPTPLDVQKFVRGTRRKPDERLAVLSGLRSFGEVDQAHLWAWLGVWVGVIALIATTPVDPIVKLFGGAAIVAVALVLLVRLLTISAAIELRTRRSRIWLRAFEDELR